MRKIAGEGPLFLRHAASTRSPGSCSPPRFFCCNYSLVLCVAARSRTWPGWLVMFLQHSQIPVDEIRTVNRRPMAGDDRSDPQVHPLEAVQRIRICPQVGVRQVSKVWLENGAGIEHLLARKVDE